MATRDTGNARERIFNQLRADIIEGKYPGGTFLVESQLCAEFGVSRTPLREALIRLAQDRYIEMIPHRGAFVPPLTMKDVQELYDLRLANDGLAAYLFAASASPDLVHRMRRSTEREAELLAAGDYAAGSIEDLNFHALYIDNCGSRRLREVIDLIDHQMLRAMRLTADENANLHASLDFHREFVEAVAEHDQSRARHVIEAHWESNKQNFIQRYIDGTIPLDI